MADKIKQELIDQGKDPNDFDIKTFKNAYSVTPKWFYEQKQIAKKENKPIIQDVDDVAEMLVYALQRIDELEARMNG
jgi:hypothetical protein